MQLGQREEKIHTVSEVVENKMEKAVEVPTTFGVDPGLFSVNLMKSAGGVRILLLQ